MDETNEDWTVVRTVYTQIDADLVRGQLEAAEIPVYVVGDGGLHLPNITFTRGVRIAVPADRAAEAEDVLGEDADAGAADAAYEENEAGDAGPP